MQAVVERLEGVESTAAEGLARLPLSTYGTYAARRYQEVAAKIRYSPPRMRRGLGCDRQSRWQRGGWA
jgi:hypothetical protein